MQVSAAGSNSRFVIHTDVRSYKHVRESTTPPIPLADLYKTMDAAAVDNSHAQSTLNACRKQIAVLDSTSCSLAAISNLRGGDGDDLAYACDTSSQNGKPLFVLNRVTRHGRLYVTWIKNYGQLPAFDLRPEFQINPEMNNLIDKEIYTDDGGSGCIISFIRDSSQGDKKTAMRSGSCGFIWDWGQDKPNIIKRAGRVCPLDGIGEPDRDFLKMADKEQSDNNTLPAPFQREETHCPQMTCPQLPKEISDFCQIYTDNNGSSCSISCRELPDESQAVNNTLSISFQSEEERCPQVVCPQMPNEVADFSRIYVAAFGAAAACLGYLAYKEAKDLFSASKNRDIQNDLSDNRTKDLEDRVDLSAWARPTGFGLGAAACLMGALKV